MLNLSSLKILKVPDLRFFCKSVKLKVSGFNKKQLFDIYNQYLACKLIQKRYREHFYKNSECSITLEKVKYPCFVFRTKFGKLFFYDYLSIVKYISKTGNVHDPMTRELYSDKDLQRLDNSIKKHYPEIKVSSTLKIKRNMSYARKVRELENDIITYQTLLEETKTVILELIDSGILMVGILEQINVGNEVFSSIDDFLLHLLEKVSIVYNLLKAIDAFWAGSFKNDFLEKLGNYDPSKTEIKNIIEFINLI
jgi:hypothetical protein